MPAIEGYLCEHCREFWEWESDAERCCSEPEHAWQCSNCYEVHYDEVDADSCCFFENDCS